MNLEPKIILVLTLLLSIASCKTTKQIEVVERVKTDTLYQSNIHYDSIYITQNHYVDRSKDTIYIRDKSTEYRYKLLKDTIHVHQVDSIPVVKEIEVIKKARYVPWYYKCLAIVGAIAILLLIFLFLRKLNIWHLS